MKFSHSKGDNQVAKCDAMPKLQQFATHLYTTGKSRRAATDVSPMPKANKKIYTKTSRFQYNLLGGRFHSYSQSCMPDVMPRSILTVTSSRLATSAGDPVLFQISLSVVPLSRLVSSLAKSTTFVSRVNGGDDPPSAMMRKIAAIVHDLVTDPMGITLQGYIARDRFGVRWLCPAQHQLSISS